MKKHITPNKSPKATKSPRKMPSKVTKVSAPEKMEKVVYAPAKSLILPKEKKEKKVSTVSPTSTINNTADRLSDQINSMIEMKI
tara:strand:+ start:95 stop:346 length:252 start_codon:yes stop_codon:yes gene_type:complete